MCAATHIVRACLVAVQNTPHHLSKHPSNASGMDSTSNHSPQRGAAGPTAAAASVVAGSSSGSLEHAGLSGNGDAAPFLSHSNRGSAAGGVQSFAAAGQCDMLLLASSTTNGGQYSAARGLSGAVR